MADLTAQRTLVKSPPELWSELSEVESLARHLGELGEIRITRVEPESTVAWEGEQVSGTVELEQSGWGTKVTFHATVPEPDQAPAPEPDVPEPVAVVEAEPVAVEPEPVVAEPEPAVEESKGFFARWLFRRRRPEPEVVEPEPEVVAEPEPEVIAEPEPEPVAVEPEPVVVESEPIVGEAAEPTVDVEHVQQVLDGTLDALGQAHHRPFSRG